MSHHNRSILATISFAVIGICLLVFIIYGNFWAEDIVKRRLAALEKNSIKFSYQNIDVKLFSGEFSIKEGVVEKVNGAKQLNLTFKEFEISGLGLFSYLFSKKIAFDKVKLIAPTIAFIHVQDVDQSGKAKGKTRDLPPVEISTLVIEDGIFKIKNKNAGDVGELLNGHFNITIDQLKKADDAFIDANSMKANFSSITYNTTDSLYKLYVEHIKYDLQQKKISVDSIQLRPRKSKYKFAHIVGHEIDRLTMFNQSLTVTGVDIRKIIQHRSYHADEVSINDLDLTVFRDKRLPFPKKLNTKLLFQSVTDLPFRFSIDTILLKNANVAYQEIVAEAKKPGIITFNDLFVEVTNLTNIDSISEKNNHSARMAAEGKIMGKGLLKTSFTLPLNAKALPATVTGMLKDFNLTTLNPMIEHVAFMKIEDGYLKTLDFNFKYDSEESSGKMEFEYSNLKVGAISKKADKTAGIRRNIKSFITNTFIINSNNLKSDKNFRVGDIGFERDKKKSLINYWWKSLLSGFKSSTGIRPEDIIK